MVINSMFPTKFSSIRSSVTNICLVPIPHEKSNDGRNQFLDNIWTNNIKKPIHKKKYLIGKQKKGFDEQGRYDRYSLDINGQCQGFFRSIALQNQCFLVQPLFPIRFELLRAFFCFIYPRNGWKKPLSVGITAKLSLNTDSCKHRQHTQVPTNTKAQEDLLYRQNHIASVGN